MRPPPPRRGRTRCPPPRGRSRQTRPPPPWRRRTNPPPPPGRRRMRPPPLRRRTRRPPHRRRRARSASRATCRERVTHLSIFVHQKQRTQETAVRTFCFRRGHANPHYARKRINAIRQWSGEEKKNNRKKENTDLDSCSFLDAWPRQPDPTTRN
jgi:hypothetical protein